MKPETPIRPEFERPPIVEQAITAVFDEIPGFGVGDFGRFWETIESEFPSCEAAAPIPKSTEFPPDAASKGFEISVVPGAPLPRVQYKQRDGGELLQVQSDRFVFNWTRFGEAPYPHSEKTMARFIVHFQAFRDYLEKRGFAPLHVTQCEVVNVNIVGMDHWGGYSAAPRVFRAIEAEPPLPSLQAETYIYSSSHAITSADGRFLGRLHTALQPVLRITDQTQAYRFELTARSAPLDDGMNDADEFFGVARSAINATFMAATTDEAHAFWGRA